MIPCILSKGLPIFLPFQAMCQTLHMFKNKQTKNYKTWVAFPDNLEIFHSLHALPALFFLHDVGLAPEATCSWKTSLAIIILQLNFLQILFLSHTYMDEHILSFACKTNESADYYLFIYFA